MDLEPIRSFSEGLFRSGGFAVKGVTAHADGRTVRVDVSLEEAGLVIGQGGEHLRMWEEVIQKKLNQGTEDHYRVSVDINNYRFEYEEKLREVARAAAKRVSVTKQPVKLQPMNAYERRVVHAELALRPDIVTESEGADPRRCVVVKLIV